jgi:hypothetical protein
LSNIRRVLILGLALLMALSLAAPALAQGAPEAQVRVAHLSPDAPNVDVSVNGQPVAALQNVPYGTISPYLPLPAGDGVRTTLAELPPPPEAEPAMVRAGAAAFGDEWVFWTGAYQLVRYGPDGEQRGLLAPPSFEPELPSDLDAEMLAETIRAYFGRPPSEGQMRGFRAKPKLPLNRDGPLRSDGRGRLWAITTRDHVRRSHFDVFERDGYAGTASVPDRVLGYDIRGDLLAALVLVPAAEPNGMHGYRVRWYRIE